MLSMSVVLKDGCTEHDPVFLINRPNNTFQYNYAKWGDRFYWITNVEYTRNQLFTVSCRLDVLATHKAGIMDTNAFISYRDTGNTWIPDRRLAISPKCSITYASAAFSEYYTSVGTYLVQCVGRGDSTGIFAMNASYLSRIMNSSYTWTEELFDDDLEILDFYKHAFSQMISAGDIPNNIRSVKWIPFDVSSVSSVVFPLRLGNYNTGIGGNSVQNEPLVSTITLSVPWQATGWRRSYPYHRLKLYIPFIGSIDLGSEFCNISAVTVKTSVSPVDGTFTASVMAGDEIVGTYAGDTSVDIMAAVAGRNITSAISAPANVLASAVTGNIAGAAASIASAASSIIGTPSMVGGLGGGSAYGLSTNVLLTCEYYEPLGTETVHGAPFMSSAKPSAGYVQTIDFSLSANAHDDELREVNALMDGGVYIE